MLEINQKETINNAKRVLKGYAGCQRLALRKVDDNINKECIERAEAIKTAIEAINKDEYRFILDNRFCKGYKYNTVMLHMGLTPATYARYQNKALLTFAETYSLSNLIVWRKNKCK